jgi:MFS family permease
VLKKITSTELAISVYFFVCGLIFSSWASRIPAIKDNFSFNDAELGAVLFTLPLGALSALPFSGWIVQKLGSKIISIFSLIIYSLSLYSISTAITATALSVALFLFGFIGNLANISMNTQGLAIQKILNKPILSKLHAMWSIGAFLAATISGWTMKLNFSTSSHFIIISLLGLLSCLSVYKFLVKDQETNEPQKVFVLPTKDLMLLGFICFCVAMSEGAMADWSSLYYRMILKDVQQISTVGYTAFAFSMAIGRFVGDKLIQLFGYQRVLKLNGLFILIGMTIALVFQSPLTVIVGFSLVGLGVSSVFPVVYILAAKTSSMSPSAALSAVSSVGFFGFLVGPPIIGFVAAQTGLRFALGIVAFLGLFIWMLTFKTKK